MKETKLTIGTQSSVTVERCQICGNQDLSTIIFLGYLPPVNTMPLLENRPHEQPAYPAQLLKCNKAECQLVQIGTIVDPEILFPPTYPYTSGTTKILRDNFADLYKEVYSLYGLNSEDLIVDIGSNDGTLLSNFKNHKILGIEPTNAANLANERGIETMISFFNADSAKKALKQKGPAKIITATNVFAHIEDIHSIVDAILLLLKDDGIFINESHYLADLIRTVQYDTVYHEHLRYYSLTSMKYLLELHGLEVIHARRIPTHGGSIRVYSARKGKYKIENSVHRILEEERETLTERSFQAFRKNVVMSKLQLYALLADIKSTDKKVYGIGAPSRASTLINYVGLDDGVIDCVVEVKGSYKINKYIPGTMIPVYEEERLFRDQPEYALLFSWHIANELIPKLTEKGFRGKYIVPLPIPKIVS